MDIVTNLVENLSSLLIFSISDVDYCLSNTTVSSVIRPDNVYKVKLTDGEKYSLLCIESKSIPLIDLKKIFHKKEQKIDSDTRVIIVEYADIQFGLLAEKVKEMIAVDADYIKNSGRFIPEKDSLYIEGILELESKKLIMPNIKRIISDIIFF